MEDFIRKAAGSLGISEDVTRSATGGLLGLLKEKAGGTLLNSILSKIPDLKALVG